jgi:hypothetical protein
MSETDTTAVTPVTTTDVSTIVQTVIYCGPTLPRKYGLPQYQIFNNGLPVHLEQTITICPAINSLIVPIEQLAVTRIAIDTKGSAQASLYQAIVKAFTKAVKK